jgi:hypothetical protein
VSYVTHHKNMILWTPAYIPDDRPASWMYSTPPPTYVQYLYISCYLSDNKPVLSYLLLPLLPQYYCCNWAWFQSLLIFTAQSLKKICIHKCAKNNSTVSFRNTRQMEEELHLLRELYVTAARKNRGGLLEQHEREAWICSWSIAARYAGTISSVFLGVFSRSTWNPRW